MSEDLERLKEIGLHNINKDTHISLRHIKQLLEENFESLNKVQVFGFISILEREYHLNLKDLKNDVNEYFLNQPSTVNDNHSVFVVASKSKNMKTTYLSLVFIIFAIVTFLSVTYSVQESEIVVENKIIEKVKKEIVSKKEVFLEQEPKIELKKEIVPVQKLVVHEKAPIIKKEIVETLKIIELKIEEVEEVKEVVKVKELTITPRSKVWIGYINLKTEKKYQKVTKNTIVLKEDYIIVLGHSHVYLQVNENKSSFKTKGSLRLLFKDGKLRKITLQEFKKLNRGRKW